MHKWESRDNKLERRKRKPFPTFKDESHKDNSKRKDIKQARREKEALWENLEVEGDE